MHHGLTGAVGTRLVVRGAGIEFASRAGGGSAFKTTNRPALRTADARNLASLGERSDYVSALLATFDAKLFYPITNYKCLLHRFDDGNFLSTHYVRLIAICNDTLSDPWSDRMAPSPR